MMTETDFEELVAEVARINGITPAQAGEYCARIGDIPELAPHQRDTPPGTVRVAIRDETRREIVTTILWPVEEDDDEAEE